MIASMTGFGKAELLKDGVKASVEISSVNNRFCEIQLRLPKFLQELEGKIKELIFSRITRGKITYCLNWEENVPPASYVKLNYEAADVYFKIMKELKEKYGLSGDIEVEDFMSLPDLIKVEKEEYELEKAWEITREATLIALEEFDKMRKKEGEGLALDLKKRIAELDRTLDEVEKLSFLNVEVYRKRLKDRISELLGDYKIDEQRIAIEVTFLAERSDITEECVRFRSHNQQFLSALDEKEAVGKRLNFLLQEMNREANTIGSKAIHPEISRKVIFLKEEIEKIREQTQNIE
jgi:uncharacterized protein (TIGR00255 family)